MQAILRHVRFDGTHFFRAFCASQNTTLPPPPPPPPTPPILVVKCVLVASPGFVKVLDMTALSYQCVITLHIDHRISFSSSSMLKR